MRHSPRWLSCAALLAWAGVAATQAPNPKDAGASAQGTVRPIAQDQLLLQPPHDSRRQAVTETMRGLLGVVQRNPAFSPPIGLDVTPGLLARTPVVGVNRDSVQYELSAGVHWYTVKGDKVVPENASRGAFDLHANHISFVFEANETWVEDRTKQTYWEPRQIEQEAGHPYYHTHTIVMKKTDRPIWIALTKQQVLTQMLANARKAQAELPPEAEARVHELAKRDVSCLDATLARLGPAQRTEAAYLSMTQPRPPECSPLVDPNTPQARRLVTENPAFYDKNLPPSAIQVIVMSFRSIQYPPRMWQHAVIEKLRKGMDYGALANMIAGG